MCISCLRNIFKKQDPDSQYSTNPPREVAERVKSAVDLEGMKEPRVGSTPILTAVVPLQTQFSPKAPTLAPRKDELEFDAIELPPAAANENDFSIVPGILFVPQPQMASRSLTDRAAAL